MLRYGNCTKNNQNTNALKCDCARIFLCMFLEQPHTSWRIKMKNIALALTSVAAISAAPALAETTYLSFDLGYSELSDGGVSLDTLSGAAAYEGKSGKFTYGGEVTGTQYTLAGSELNMSEISLSLGYDITSAITVFAGASIFEVEDDDITSLTVGAEYAMGDLTFGAAYTNTEFDSFESDGSQFYVDYDTDAFGAYAAVAFAEDEEESYFVGLSRDVATYEVNLDAMILEGMDVYKLSGSYNILENIRLVGSVDYVDFSGSDYTESSIGAGYMVADNIWVDATYISSDAYGDTIDGFGLNVSFETGTRGLRAADRIVTTSDYFGSLAFFGPS
jgi:hypothetical protein